MWAFIGRTPKRCLRRPSPRPRHVISVAGKGWEKGRRVRTQRPTVVSLGHGLRVRTRFSPLFIYLLAV